VSTCVRVVNDLDCVSCGTVTKEVHRLLVGERSKNVPVARAHARGVGLIPLELDILQELYYLRKRDCFRILFAC